MLFADYNEQTFDWWHAQVPDAFIPGTNLNEDFQHNGLLENESLNLGLTIGLNDYWNVSLTQLISERCMIWDGPVFNGTEEYFNPDIHQIGDSKTVHHRTECSSTDFVDPLTNEVKAYGGYLGVYLFTIAYSYVSYTGSIIISLLLFTYSLVKYFNIPVRKIYEKVASIIRYLYLKSKFNLGLMYDKMNLAMQK